jgi:hypothetical protein
MQVFPSKHLLSVVFVTPSHLGVTRGDQVSWPAMKTVIPMMVIISILHRQQPLKCLPPHSAQLITPNQHGALDAGGPAHYKVHWSLFLYKVSYLIVTPCFPQFVKIIGLAKNYDKLINVNM